MTIIPTSISHVRLTVTDIDRSRRFYESVFGWPVAMELPDGVLYAAGDSLVGLRPAASDVFDENRVGLDHLAMNVASKSELDAAAAHLDSLGVGHEPVKDIGIIYILEFRDPDNIALELCAPK
ncbi:MAG TPA: VOC family protein [Mycobacterium sp.]|nr:VOC family protein [Mycobacterium sp.]